MSEQYLIWSNQHRAWWRPDSRGYTTDHAQAGRYSREDAIFNSASAAHTKDAPDEVPVREADLLKCHEVWTNTFSPAARAAAVSR
jgi:hypothetical protein